MLTALKLGLLLGIVAGTMFVVAVVVVAAAALGWALLVATAHWLDRRLRRR